MIEFRFSDFFSPYRLLYWRRLLWKSQYWPVERFRELQWKLLSRILDHCFTHVAYYRNLIKDLGLKRSDFRSLEDLSLLPILEKDVVIQNHEDFKPDNFDKYHAQEVRSSGTTGTPIVLYWDRFVNALELTCQWRHFSWMGYRLGDPFLDIRSEVLDAPNGYTWNWKCRALEFSSDDVNPSNITRYADVIRRYRIKMWRGHPTSLHQFCHLLNDAGIDDVKPKILVASGEVLHPHQRQFMESWAGIPVFDNYGLREHNALIYQCPEGGYHVSSEYGYIEIIKDDGTYAAPGEQGRIIATDLHKRVFPLLRYNTKDYAVQSNRMCSCGRTLPLAERIVGRNDDYLLTSDGRWVTNMRSPLHSVSGIRLGQIIQKYPGSLEVYIVPFDDYKDEYDDILIRVMKEKLGETMDVRLHRVEEVPYRSPGKFKFVINQITRTPPKSV